MRNGGESAQARREGRLARIRALAGGLLFLACLWAFAELADDAPEGDYLALETRLLLALRSPADLSRPIGPAWLPEAARDLTALGSPLVVTLVATLATGFVLLRGRVRTALLLVAGSAGGYALNHALKALFERERPSVVPHLVEESSASFPSGHSMVGLVVYATLGALLARVVPGRREKLYLLGTALAVSVAIGLSRVYLGVHYPTDVLAGWSVGLAWALLCWGAHRALDARARRARTRAGEPEAAG